jgi:hypothetical protein
LRPVADFGKLALPKVDSEFEGGRPRERLAAAKTK